MYTVKLEKQTIDLLPDQSVTLERYNPMFDFDTVRGSKVNDFTIPFSPINDRIMRWYGHHQTKFQPRQYACEKYADGILIEKGFVELSDVSDDGYQVFFSQNLSEIFGDIQNTPLNKIDFGTVPFVPKADFNISTDAYALPMVKNASYYGTNTKEGFNGILNEYVGGAYTEGCPKVPMFSLRWLFAEMSQRCNFNFSGEFTTSVWFQRGLLDSTYEHIGTAAVKPHLCLPEITFPTLLKELKKIFNLSLCFDATNRLLVMKYSRTLFNQPTRINLTDKVVPSASRRPLTANRLELDWELDTEDNLMKTPPYGFGKNQTAGDGTLFQVKSIISTRYTDIPMGIAAAEQVGQSAYFNQLNARNSPKLLLWNGILHGKPTASNTHGTYRLALTGGNNLVDTYYAEHRAWLLRTASRTVQANLTAADLARLDFHRTAGADVAVHIYGKDYFVESLRVNLPLTGYTTLNLWER